jgi:hypothetical protein
MWELGELGAEGQEFVAFCVLILRKMEKWFHDRVLVPAALR